MKRALAMLAFSCGLLLATPLVKPLSAQKFRAATNCPSCIAWWYYADHNDSFVTQDWNCGTSTYDGHTGSDFSLRENNAGIEKGYEVVAVANGTVISTQDGFFDRCTQCGGANCGLNFGNGFANQVIIDHGSHRVIYGHMRMGSVKVKMGDAITCGQVLGQIGSSGCSTGAHLHVEPRTKDNRNAVEPYFGDCSNTTASLWVMQAYKQNPSSSCDGEPTKPVCPADSFPIWTCNDAKTARRRCVDGMDTTEMCSAGCTAMAQGVDDVCAPAKDADGDGTNADLDCADMDATRHPGAVDKCGDGIDQDCSGKDEPCTMMPAGGAGGMGASGSAARPAGGAGGMVGMSGMTAPGGVAGVPAGMAGLGTAGGAGTVTGSAGLAPGLGGMWGFGQSAGPVVGVPPRTQAADSGCRIGAPGSRASSRLWPFAALALAFGLRARARRRLADSAKI